MRHQKRSHRYQARQSTREAAREVPAAELPEKLADAVQACRIAQHDPYAELPSLDLKYGLSRHMKDMNLERKWQVCGNEVKPRTHAPSVHERLREAERYQALRNVVAQAKAARKGR